jgi:hypothetical protein
MRECVSSDDTADLSAVSEFGSGMLDRLRGNLAVPIVLITMCAIEAFALRAHTLGFVLIGVICAMAVLTIVSHADMRVIAMGSAYACAFTLTWNGWFVGPVRPGDVLILITLLCFAVVEPATAFRTPPWWVKQLAFVLLLGVVLIVLFPPDPSYLEHRLRIGAGGQDVPLKSTDVSLVNIGVAAKFIIAIAAIPMAFTAAALVDRRAVRRLGIAFTTGTALSGLVAFIDHTGVASLGHYITHLPNISARQIGFANHPNFLAAGLVLAIPFACWMLVSYTRWERRVGAFCLLSMLLGVFASGSRGGAVCAVGAVVLSFALLPRSRPHLPGILLGGLALVAVVAAAVPSLGLEILRVTRLVGNPTTQGSDIVRSQVGAQGWADFRHSWIHGIGLQDSTDASQVYIQELASGGLLLFLGMSTYMLGGAWAALRAMQRQPLAAAVLASIGATLALNVFEADLTDRFYYVPEAILVAVLARAKRDAEQPAVDAPEPAPGRHEIVGARA